MSMDKYFYNHGYFCASHPLEVILVTLTGTTCLVSMSLFVIGDDIFGVSDEQLSDKEAANSLDSFALVLARFMAIVYVYLQFRSLRKLGSKYLLGISGIFTVVASFVFSVAVMKIFRKDLSGLSEALPLFLLLVDLSKACALARYALGSADQQEVKVNIAEGMKELGPSITMDAVVEMLVIGIGSHSGVHQLEMMSYFGCLSILANLLVFMSFYPACLALVLEVARERNGGQPLRHLKHLAGVLEAGEKDKKPNAVIQRVKLIMAAGLVMVHVHSRWSKGAGSGQQSSTSLGALLTSETLLEPDMDFWQFHVHRLFTTKIDVMLTLVLATFLVAKYILFDGEADVSLTKCPSCMKSSPQITPVTPTAENFTLSFNTDAEVLVKEQPDPKPEFQVGGGDTGDEDEEEEGKKDTASHSTQTSLAMYGFQPLQRLPSLHPPRPITDCLEILKSDEGPSALMDEEIISLVNARHIPAYKLEVMLGDYERGVNIRRQIISSKLSDIQALENLPYTNQEYQLMYGACCENVVGVIPIPVGIAGPLLLDGKMYHVPMATTEGCLVASTNRGCRALQGCGGIQSTVIGDGMSRAPVVRCANIKRASKIKLWLEDTDNFDKVKESFDSTSRFARLQKLQVVQASRYLYIRFVAKTGDAMGMNMLSKGAEKALTFVLSVFPDMEILSLSGNFCTDKKPSAVNWLEGRGKSVVCEAVIPHHIIKDVLKTSVAALVDLNISKNMMGSAMAGSIGGFNAHAANVVTAIFIATGQDPAQNVCSSNCMTVMEATGENNEDLYISCTMPSIEVGTVGGGTILSPQAAALKVLGVKGSGENAGENARLLAQIICGAVLAGELSLMSALAAGHLVKSHLKHNRSVLNVQPGSTPTDPTGIPTNTLSLPPSLPQTQKSSHSLTPCCSSPAMRNKKISSLCESSKNKIIDSRMESATKTPKLEQKSSLRSTLIANGNCHGDGASSVGQNLRKTTDAKTENQFASFVMVENMESQDSVTRKQTKSPVSGTDNVNLFKQTVVGSSKSVSHQRGTDYESVGKSVVGSKPVTSLSKTDSVRVETQPIVGGGSAPPPSDVDMCRRRKKSTQSKGSLTTIGQTSNATELDVETDCLVL